MAGLRIVCGVLLLAVSVLSMQAASAQSRARPCGARYVKIGPAYVGGCWLHQGSLWRSPTPVTLNGLKITGTSIITVDGHARTITSSSSVRWLIGTVQFRRALLAWRVQAPLRFTATGAVRGLSFAGPATLTLSRSDGGTARLATNLAIPGAGGGVSGSTVLKGSGRHGFKMQQVRLHVGQLSIGRLFFKQLEFRYGQGLWAADAEVRLPVFTGSSATLAGHLEIARGTLSNIGVTGKGLDIPLGEGFVLTSAGLDLGLGPLVIQGSGSATFGPPIGGSAALELDGKLQYSSEPERWEATGTVSLPWSLPGLRPTANVGLEIHPGRAMMFTSDIDLSVHGIGLTGGLDGFASASGFNAEGDAKLNFVLVKLSGTALVSSKGMAACGAVRFLFFKHKLGFGYTWNGPLSILGSSCDVGRFRVSPQMQRARSSAPTQIMLPSSPAGFAVFAAKGGDFEISGPTGAFTSTPDRDGSDAFAFHDTTDGTAYLAIPTVTAQATYTVTPLNGASLQDISVANGLKTHAGQNGLPSPDVTGTVSGSGSQLNLSYGIDTSQFQPGEEVSLYQGQSSSLAGASPIVEDIPADHVSSGTAQFTPEPLGSTQRYVFAVVSIDGHPREQFFVTPFTATPVALPSAAVFLRQAAGIWTVQFGKPQRVDHWQVLITAGDGTRDWHEAPGNAATFDVPSTTVAPATIQLTPVDKFGRDGPTYGCDTTKPGSCPAL